jgi:two-component system, chemotaxis family, response regulator PixG
MTILPITRYRFLHKLQPVSLLAQIASKPVNGCLQVFTISDSWAIYLEEGKIIYASQHGKMFQILYEKLQFLGQQIASIESHLIPKLKAIFETGIDNQAIANPEYIAICWLVNQKYLTLGQARMLVELVILEVLDSFLKLEEGSYEFSVDNSLSDLPKFCYFDSHILISQYQKRSQNRGGHRQSGIVSPQSPQSPQFFQPNQISMKNKAEAQSVTQQINSQTSYANNGVKSDVRNHSNGNNNHKNKFSIQDNEKKLYKILCIDDSPTVLNAMNNYLSEQMFEVVTINDSLKALMYIIRLKPNLILLDINMPKLDGYELCSLVRKHSLFKSTPVIMVTARTGFIDKAKAKMVRASGYLTKPFTQAELLKIIFQYIA